MSLPTAGMRARQALGSSSQLGASMAASTMRSSCGHGQPSSTALPTPRLVATTAGWKVAKRPLPEGIAVHVFTQEALPQPKSGRPLSLHSHAKQRKLFQQLFARCTGVICSSGNETIWEAVCRGVPVLTIPSKGNGEQMLNAVAHATNHPLLVRHRPKLRADDVHWLATFAQTEATRQESEALRSRVSTLMDGGPGALESHLSKVGVARQPTPVQDL